MLRKLYEWLDYFLPAELPGAVNLPVLYRARLVVAANIAGIIIVASLFIGANLLHISLVMKIGISLGLISLISLLIFLKTRLKNFETSLVIGSTIQVIVLSIAVYFSCFSENGMGYFGLIWLFPLVLMNAFYFTKKMSIFLFALSFIFYMFFSFYFYQNFNDPFLQISNFREVFIFFLTLVLIFCFMQAYLFVQLSEQLQLEVAKQRDQLKESAKFQSLGQMASHLAHDINNPLFSIQGKLHQMRNLLSNDQLDLEKCDQIVENIEETILKLSQIVKGISTFAREGQGDQMVLVSLNELVEGVMFIASDRFMHAGIKANFKASGQIKLICYPSFISQVLLNLLNNAIDALDGIVDKKIEVEIFSNKEWIEIHVIDNGPGVDKEIENKIFDPFFTTKKFGKGTGLGLSISRGLIDTHDGELDYRRIDQKTDFFIRLPSYE